MGRRKIRSEEEFSNIKLPVANDVMGIAKKNVGFDRLLVSCQDGKERLCRIRGKMKRRMWIRQGDIVLVSPWDFQSARAIQKKSSWMAKKQRIPNDATESSMVNYKTKRARMRIAIHKLRETEQS